ncbi:DNA-directed RNA polymerase subunit beta [Candidatus Hodgkinia cicadicola]|uniref:DNA-directed RNA polymerase subunit beta n=1 Tax=Candidatus Hodgkinia cicadicola TaxID=573658 RepID=A0ABX4MEG6_9HYPH|nr:DNA-directed RNA polymerase subunit beta [Candidatus Hodgkinia cicadicola]
MSTRFDFNNNLVDKIPLTHGGLQNRLYKNTLWGCYNDKGIKISKLELNLRTLFPSDFGHWSLDLTKPNNFIKDKKLTSFELHLNVVQYYLDKDIMFVCYRFDLDVPLVDLPRLPKDEVLTVNGTKKTLIMQLTKQSAVLFDQETESINLKDKHLGYLRISGPKIEHNTHESDLLTSLLRLKTKHSHIFKGTFGTHDVGFYKGKWCQLTWNNPQQNRLKYNSRWSFRCKKKLEHCPEMGNGIITSTYINRSKVPFVNIGERIILDKHTALNYPSPITITESPKILNVINELDEATLEGESEITSEEINNVELTFPGRIFLNDLTKNHLDFGLDLLTKKDLILIWNEISINLGDFKHANCDIRVVRSSGDVIIDVIKKTLEHVLDVGGTNGPTDDAMMVGNLLESVKQIQNDVDKFFNSSSLCQYLDQVNSLSEISHRNKLTYMGESGLTQQNVEVNIRDTKRCHLAKICPIESPEGQNVGLVSTLSTYANVDVNGYMLTGYYKNYNGLINSNVIYLNYFESMRLNVALSCNKNQRKKVMCLNRNKVKITDRRVIDLSLVSNVQVFSHAARLIPFLGHNDPTRALMATNMLKQAIPPLNPRPPLVGTGEEYNVMRDTGHNVVARNDGRVISVDSKIIIVYEPRDRKRRVYILPQVVKSNQEMCQRIRTVVNPGQTLKQGDVIAECQSSCDGEISLGANLLVAFMCWEGYNFEDSVIISDNVIIKGIFKSFHITDLETKVMKTPSGNEWLSSNIVGIPMKYRRHLDHNGIVKVGSNVRKDDVLVGKLTPRSDAKRKKEESKKIHGDELSSDGEHESDNGTIINMEDGSYEIGSKQKEADEFSTDLTYNTSLRVPDGIEYATVLEVNRSSDEDRSYHDKDLEEYIRCYNVVTKKYIRRCCMLLHVDNKVTPFSTSSLSSGNKFIQNGLNLLHKNYLSYLNKLEVDMLSKFNNRLTNENHDDEGTVLEVITIKLLVHKSIKIGDKICGRHGNKGVISKIVPKEDMPFMADGTPIDIILNPLGVPSRMNIGQLLETTFGLISYKYGLEFKNVLNMYNKTNDDRILVRVIPKLTELYPNINKLTKDMILILLSELSHGVKISCPLFEFPFESCLKDFNKRLSINFNGKIQLYDGITGLPFDKTTTVGVIYIFKLNHLVDDKIHARSTGPYSIVTQQPLKGKDNLGGQRLGEMEVWALQSYGAACFLNESLSAKCDDIVARHEIQENILKGKPKYNLHQIESMSVLVKEMFSMCIEIETPK